MAKVKMNDGSVKEVENGSLILSIAKELGVLKSTCVAKLNGKLVDLKTPIEEDSELELIPFSSKEAFEVINHSCAHLMAQAMKRLYPGTRYGVGPAIEEGFYYDFAVPSPVSNEDLEKIEAEMKKIAKENISVNHYKLSKAEAKEKFKDDKYKCELIDAIDDDLVGIYEQGDYADVCRGPHVLSTGMLKYFKLLNVAGAYWRGDSKNDVLTRIYGTCWASEEELNNHLAVLEDRKERDHRKLGKQLGIFMFGSHIGRPLPIPCLQDCPDRIRRYPFRPTDVVNLWGDPTKAKAKLGWNPNTPSQSKSHTTSLLHKDCMAFGL
ncbi:MAG: TGS domain-containing protein [Lachnospira sp.]|nr:TGS domain-containing protein [Lachnospira sp.]